MRDSAIISVIGFHAGASPNDIVREKLNDVQTCNFAFWMMKSHKATPELIKKMVYNSHKDISCYFIVPSNSTKSNQYSGCTPTKTRNIAKRYSIDNKNWLDMPTGMSEVTGHITGNTYSLVLNNIEVIDEKLDLGQYAEWKNENEPVKLGLGQSTVCAYKQDMSNHPECAKNRNRQIIVKAKLVIPYVVYITK